MTAAFWTSQEQAGGPPGSLGGCLKFSEMNLVGTLPLQQALVQCAGTVTMRRHRMETLASGDLSAASQGSAYITEVG